MRLIAAVAAAGAVGYLCIPASGEAIQKGITNFRVNIRYAPPCIALALLLIPVLIRRRTRNLYRLSAILFLVVTAISQLSGSLWPRQPGRHAAFLALVTVGALMGIAASRAAGRSRRAAIAAVVPLGVALLVAGFVAQHHYFGRRYLTASSTDPALTSLYQWAQHVSHARIALYGTVEQYPFYSARDTNRVTYLGMHLPNGGFGPITTCALWRHRLQQGGYDYVVLTPGPTRAIPTNWTRDDPTATLSLRPAPGYSVYALANGTPAGTCST